MENQQENKTYKVTVWGRFPSLNEYINASRIHKAKANNMKKQAENQIIIGLYTWLKGVKIKKPIELHYTFYEANKKRDLDNVSGFFHKVFQDALVRAGFIENDNWNYIIGFSDKFYIDKNVPRVDIEIVEVKKIMLFKKDDKKNKLIKWEKCCEIHPDKDEEVLLWDGKNRYAVGHLTWTINRYQWEDIGGYYDWEIEDFPYWMHLDSLHGIEK